MTALITNTETGHQEFHGNVKEVEYKFLGDAPYFNFVFENGQMFSIFPGTVLKVKITESGAN